MSRFSQSMRGTGLLTIMATVPAYFITGKSPIELIMCIIGLTWIWLGTQARVDELEQKAKMRERVANL